MAEAFKFILFVDKSSKSNNISIILAINRSTTCDIIKMTTFINSINSGHSFKFIEYNNKDITVNYALKYLIVIKYTINGTDTCKTIEITHDELLNKGIISTKIELNK